MKKMRFKDAEIEIEKCLMLEIQNMKALLTNLDFLQFQRVP